MSYPTETEAKDIWSLKDQYIAEAGDNWPVAPINPLYLPESFDLTSMSSTAEATQAGVVTGNSHIYGFDPSGQYLFWAEYSSLNIRRATASTAFDITTLTNTQSIARSFGSAQFGVELNRQGTKIFSYGYDTNNDIYSATLSTPWDLTTISSWTGSGSILLSRYNNGIRFSFDGTKLFTAGYNQSTGIRQYDLSTPFDASTATYVTGIATSNNTTSLFFSGDGQNLVYYDNTAAAFRQVNLSTPFELSSAGTPTTVLSVSYGRGAYIDPQDEKFITYDQTNSTLYQYPTTASPTDPVSINQSYTNAASAYSGTIYTRTITQSGTYTFTVEAAAGKDNSGVAVNNGRSIQVSCVLLAGDVIYMLPASMGTGKGAGGGSFLMLGSGTSTPICVAGGGGGTDNPKVALNSTTVGQPVTSNGAGATSTVRDSSNDGWTLGGVDGNGSTIFGAIARIGADAGAGLFTDGRAGQFTGSANPARAYANGGNGGDGTWYGGFGGGGGGDNSGGGGAGGYSGGGGIWNVGSGGGGGSFVASTINGYAVTYTDNGAIIPTNGRIYIH